MIGIDAEYIAFTGLAEVPLDIADPIDAIARNPTERHVSRKGALDHLDRKLRLGRKADVVRHICGLQASRIVGPALRQIARQIDEGIAVTLHVGSKNTDLTVRNFARRTSILPRYSARCLALLEKAGLIDHQHRVLVGKMLSDIVAHHIAQSIGIPPVTAPAAAMAQDRPPPPPASIRFYDARRQADRPRIGPRSMLCGPARTMDASVSSPLAATMPTTRASSQSMLLSSMISESW